MFCRSKLAAIFILPVLSLFAAPRAMPCGDSGGALHAVAAQEISSGGWSIEPATGDKVRLRLYRRQDGSVSSQIPLARLQGLDPAQINSDAPRVAFQLVR